MASIDFPIDLHVAMQFGLYLHRAHNSDVFDTKRKVSEDFKDTYP